MNTGQDHVEDSTFWVAPSNKAGWYVMTGIRKTHLGAVHRRFCKQLMRYA